MRYKRHFNYEVHWDSMYYHFEYLQDARRFVKNKTKWSLVKCWYDNGHFMGYTWIESSI